MKLLLLALLLTACGDTGQTHFSSSKYEIEDADGL
jgi:hypothetical protein